MAGYIITTILLVIVLSIQRTRQNFGFWKAVVIGCLTYVIMYDIKSIVGEELKEYSFVLWITFIMIACIGVLILLTGEEKSYISSGKGIGL